MVPVCAAPEFGATANPTLPFPVPEAPLVTVIQLALDEAVHPHVAALAVTVTEPLPPVASTV
jgi:hypothetical protein